MHHLNPNNVRTRIHIPRFRVRCHRRRTRGRVSPCFDWLYSHSCFVDTSSTFGRTSDYRQHGQTASQASTWKSVPTIFMGEGERRSEMGTDGLVGRRRGHGGCQV